MRKYDLQTDLQSVNWLKHEIASSIKAQVGKMEVKSTNIS